MREEREKDGEGGREKEKEEGRKERETDLLFLYFSVHLIYLNASFPMTIWISMAYVPIISFYLTMY